MRQKVLRLLVSLAVMLLSAAFASGAADPGAAKYEVKEWTGTGALILHDMEREADGTLVSSGPDPYAELTDVDMHIRSLAVYCPSIQRKVQEVPGTLQLYYDLGDDYFEVYSVQVKLKEGCTRIVLQEKGLIQNLRFDFFSEEGSAVSIDRITVNEKAPGPAGSFVAAAVLMTAAALLAGWLCGGAGWLLFLAGDAALLAGCGTPVLAYGDAGAAAFFCIFVLAAVMLLAVMLFMKEGRRKERIFAMLLVLTAAAFYFSWSYMMPYGEGPDEAMHYDVVDFIHTYGFLPRGDDPRIRNDIWGFSYAFSPILPFIIGAGIDAVLKLFTTDFFVLIMGARMVSILSGALCVFLVFRIGCRLFPGEKARYALPLAVGFFPELAFLFTYINSDGFAIMTTALIILFWIRGIDSGWVLRDQAGLAAGISLCALTYYNCYGFILLSVPLFLFSCVSCGKDRRFIISSAARITLLVFLMCGWWFIRNGILYNGDILGRHTLNATEELYALPEYRPSNIRTPQKDGISIFTMIFEMGWLKSTYESFIAMFSHYRLPGRVLIFRIFKRYYALAAPGIMILFVRWIRKWKISGKAESGEASLRAEASPAGRSFRTNAVLHVNLIFSALIPAGLAIYYSYASDYQPQGRYVMPCIIPLMYFCVLGFRELERTVRRVFRRMKGRTAEEAPEIRTVPAVLAIFHLVICFNIFFDTVWPYYH